MIDYFIDINIFITYLSAFSCMVLIYGVKKSQTKSKTSKSIINFLLSIGLAYFFRAFGHSTEVFIYHQISYICYLIVPIAILVFLEASVEHSLKRVIKTIFLLLGMILVFKVLAMKTPFRGWWRILYISYMTGSIVTMILSSWIELKSFSCRNERSILGAISLIKLNLCYSGVGRVFKFLLHRY